MRIFESHDHSNNLSKLTNMTSYPSLWRMLVRSALKTGKIVIKFGYALLLVLRNNHKHRHYTVTTLEITEHTKDVREWRRYANMQHMCTVWEWEKFTCIVYTWWVTVYIQAQKPKECDVHVDPIWYHRPSIIINSWQEYLEIFD